MSNVLSNVIPSPSRLWREREGSRVSNSRFLAPLTRALGMTTVLFTIILAGLACDSGGTNSSDAPCATPKDDQPAWREESNSVSDVTDKEGPDSHNPFSDTDSSNWLNLGNCGDGVCAENESCACDCPCKDGEVCKTYAMSWKYPDWDFSGVPQCITDPLADYYWIEGQWKREKDGFIISIEISGWKDKTGAWVIGFFPCNGYVVKQGDKKQFLFYGKSQNGESQCAGTIDSVNKKNVFRVLGEFEWSEEIVYIKL